MSNAMKVPGIEFHRGRASAPDLKTGTQRFCIASPALSELKDPRHD